MCERKKRCIACKKVLPIDKFPKYKKTSGELGDNNTCKACERARDSKVMFKKRYNIEAYIRRTMHSIRPTDY